jgi:hypothetical protein
MGLFKSTYAANVNRRKSPPLVRHRAEFFGCAWLELMDIRWAPIYI